MPERLAPMLASLPEGEYSRSGMIYEPKLDGMRALAFVKNGQCRLVSRRFIDITDQYPSLAAELSSLTTGDALLDGEIIALNEKGRPSFQHLQQRMNLLKKADITRAEATVPVFYFAFDIVHARGFDLRAIPLSQRKEILAESLRQSDRVRILSYFEEDGRAAYEACIENGFEGIVAKKFDSTYEPGRRSPCWIKVKAQQTDEFLIGGYKAGQGSRSTTFGALLLGSYQEDGSLLYCGSVGTGFDQRQLKELLEAMKPLEQKACPFINRPEDKKNVTWLEPELVAEVKFMDWTRDRHLRTPVFLRLRDDKDPADICLEPVRRNDSKKSNQKNRKKTTKSPAQTLSELIAGTGEDRLEAVVEGDTLEFSHLSKIMWPAGSTASGALTKRDYLAYIALVSPYMLAHLQDRPLSFLRSPEGVTGKPFYQKHWNLDLPDFVETCLIEKDGESTELSMCNNLASLMWFSQHSTIEFHAWLSRMMAYPKEEIGEGDSPDFMVFDLDSHSKDEDRDKKSYRKDSFLSTCEAAAWLKEALDQVQLEGLMKTSGRNGLHVYVPMVNTLEHEEARILAETICRYVIQKHPGRVTVNAYGAKQEGLVLLDYSPNCRGKTLVAPYSARLMLEQTVSAPIDWSELGDIFPDDLTISTVPERVAGKGDLWADWQRRRRDLESMLRRK
ncbi:MAG: DNA ligase D [Candidatus Obscuribacterales bacterium]